MPDNNSTQYINSVDYKDLEDKLKDLDSIIDDLSNKSWASRQLRYNDVDIEAEREEGRLAPDELYIPQHIIDTNIRREQSSYVQYITQSPRAVICEDMNDDTVDLALLDKDLTKKIRFPGWQLSQFANIDGFQANGYAMMEVVYDANAPGGVSHEAVQFGDFGYRSDTRDIQAVELTGRAYYFTRTRLLALCGDGTKPDDWKREQVEKVISATPDSSSTQDYNPTDNQNKSLYRIKKWMFRVNGVVNVAWGCPAVCDGWMRDPRPLYIGRRKIKQSVAPQQPVGAQLMGAQANQGVQEVDGGEAYETQYPYIVFPYLISENDTIAQLKGRVYMDQDLQEGVTSLMSSTVTQARRASMLLFSKDSTDPNDDVLQQKNINFKNGALINSKVTQLSLQAPDSAMFQAINMLQTSGQNETSQVNFAVQNRKDSRKTAKEVSVAESQEQELSTVQVVLYALALTTTYTLMTEVIVTRVKAGLLKVNQQVRPLYDRTFIVKPSGDIDVIEKQQMIQMMMNTWPVIQNTPAAQAFLADLIELMFPLNASKYIATFQQAMQQQQGNDAQVMQQTMGMLKQLAQGIVKLSKHPEFFSESGRVHAFPVVEHYGEELEQLEQQLNKGKGKK